MAVVCTQSDVAFNVTLSVLQVPTLIFCLAFPYPYIVAYRAKALRTTKLQFYLGFIFIVLITLHNLAEVIQASTGCNAPTVSAAFDVSRNALYVVQASMLAVLLFLRLVFIFKDTQFELSQRTIYTFVGLLVFAILMFIGLVALLFTPSAWGILPFLVVLGFLDYVCGLICINYLFIRRLLKVYSGVKDSVTKESGLKYVATKNAVLCVVSSSTILLSMIGIVLYLIDPGHAMAIAYNVLLQFDVVTNLLSVVLTYSRFDAWYQRLCGCCHRRCGACCLCCVQSKLKNQAMIDTEQEQQVELESATSPDTQTDTQQEL